MTRWLPMILFLACWGVAGILLHEPVPLAAYDYRDDPDITSWLSKKEAERLMRFHGVPGLKITAGKVYIPRDGKWICVYNDPPYPLEKSIASGNPGETLLASAEEG